MKFILIYMYIDFYFDRVFYACDTCVTYCDLEFGDLLVLSL